jgi:L-lactate dehydrogenase (cytochrome)
MKCAALLSPLLSPTNPFSSFSMRLLGAPTLADITPDMLDTSQLSARGGGPADFLMRTQYEPLSGVANGLGAQPRLATNKASL